jgi:hypothetical protein
MLPLVFNKGMLPLVFNKGMLPLVFNKGMLPLVFIGTVGSQLAFLSFWSLREIFKVRGV